jgi:sugar O-acyltransferase (sialic acid O-acetyltransferase NeuD family)
MTEAAGDAVGADDVPLVLFGCSGHAKVVLEAILARRPDRRVTILDDSAESRLHPVLGRLAIGDRSTLRNLARSKIALGVGQNHARAKLMAWLEEEGRQLETVVHPGALVGASVILDQGVFVAAGAVIVAEARVDAGAIINTGATVDHDCVIGMTAHIGPGSNLCGNVTIGARTLVGVGSSVRPGVKVGDDIVIGAGSVVVRDLVDPGTYAGNPARKLG